MVKQTDNKGDARNHRVVEGISELPSVFLAVHHTTKDIGRYVGTMVGCKPKHLHVLKILSKLGLVSMGELSDILDMSPPQATVLCDEVVEAGLIERLRGEQDRRKVYVELSERGSEIIAESMDIFSKLFDKVAERIPEDEVERAISLLKILIDTIEEVQREEGTKNEDPNHQ